MEALLPLPSEPDLQVKYPAQASDYGYVVPRWICWWQDVPIGSWVCIFPQLLGVYDVCGFLPDWRGCSTYRTDTTLSESHLLETFSIVFSISQLLCCQYCFRWVVWEDLRDVSFDFEPGKLQQVSTSLFVAEHPSILPIQVQSSQYWCWHHFQPLVGCAEHICIVCETSRYLT